ncbi:unnamed protein product [Ectocarpus sp. 4 AP-2014]
MVLHAVTPANALVAAPCPLQSCHRTVPMRRNPSANYHDTAGGTSLSAASTISTLRCQRVAVSRGAAAMVERGRRGRRRGRGEISPLGEASDGRPPDLGDGRVPSVAASYSVAASAGEGTTTAAADSNGENSGGNGGSGGSSSRKSGNRSRKGSYNSSSSNSSSSNRHPARRIGSSSTPTRTTTTTGVADPRRRRRLGNVAAARQTEQKQKDYLHLIKAAGFRGNWREVAALVSEMGGKGVKGNVYIYNTAIAAMARCGRPREAEALLTVMLERDSIAPDTISYNSAINGHARCGDLGAARRLLGRMTELASSGALLHPDQFTYNAVANAAAKRGDAVAAAEVLKTMAEAGVTPNIITYNSCLAACKAKGDLRRAVVLLEMMREDGIDPDQRSYSAAIATAGIRGLWEEVQGFLETMRDEDLTPDTVTFNTAIKAVADNGQCDVAFSLLAEMKNEGLTPDQISYNGVLGACGNAGEWKAALRLLEDMRQAGVTPNAYNYSAAMDACGKAGRQREALALLGHMRKAGVRADTACYNAAIDACSVAMNWTAALQLLQEMRLGVAGAASGGAPGGGGTVGVEAPPPPDVVSYSSAITACARARRVDEALGLLSELRVNEAHAAAATVRGGMRNGSGRRAGLPVPNVVAYSAGLFACLKAGDVARGAELLDEMIAAGLRPNKIHCDTMVAAWSAEGKPERAVALMRRLQSHGFEPSLYTYETIVWGFAKGANWAAAVRFLAYVLGLGLQPSVRSWDAAIAACSQAGHWERALALLADMRKQGIRPSKVTYTAAVVGINRRRYTDWAPELANIARLLQNGPGSHGGGGGGTAPTQEGGEKAGADGDVGKGEGGGGGRGSGGGGRPSPEELDCSIEALGDADDAGGATSLLRVMRREGFHASPRAYRSVVYACARVGLLDEAMTLAKEMQSSSSSAFAAQRQQAVVERPKRLREQLPSSFNDDCEVENRSIAEETPADEPPALGDGASLGAAASFAERGLEEETEREAGNGGVASELVPRGVPSTGAASGGDCAQEGSLVANNDRSNSNLGDVNEDEDGAEFDLAMVYNCIISNFARAATGDGGGAGGVCDHRIGRAPAGASVLAVAEKAAAVAASAVAEETGVGGGEQGGRSGPGKDGRRAEALGGDVPGEGLVALLFGVAERAEGSLTDEVANGGVEIDHDEEVA